MRAEDSYLHSATRLAIERSSVTQYGLVNVNPTDVAGTGTDRPRHQRVRHRRRYSSRDLRDTAADCDATATPDAITTITA